MSTDHPIQIADQPSDVDVEAGDHFADVVISKGRSTSVTQSLTTPPRGRWPCTRGFRRPRSQPHDT